jgi:hypothetical protein
MPAWTPSWQKEASQREVASTWQEAEGGLGWEEACLLSTRPPPIPGNCGIKYSSGDSNDHFPSMSCWLCRDLSWR